MLEAAQTSVMILAAGRGERMLPLTKNTPKPLLKLAGKRLIEYHLERLAAAGFKDIVINLAYLGDQIEKCLGNGDGYGIHIHYSDERNSGALETAGGIIQALPLISSDQFLVVNGDVYTDFPFQRLLHSYQDSLGETVLVPNPPHNLKGDFDVSNNLLRPLSMNPTVNKQQGFTFAGIARYHKRLFRELAPGKQALAPLLQAAAQRGQLQAQVYNGVWVDVGTPERLQQLHQALTDHPPSGDAPS